MHLHATTYLPRLFLLLLWTLIVIGCKKSTPTEPDPDVAGKVSGRYTFSTVTTSSSGSQPITVSNGTIIILRNGTALETVDLTLSYATVGSSGSSSFTETKTLTLKAAGDAVDLYNGAAKVGTWTATQLTFISYPFNNSSVNLTATK